MRIVFPDPIDIPEASKQRLLDLGVEIHEDAPSGPDEIIDRIKDAEVITANYIDVTAEIIDGAPKLRYIISPAVGYDWIDAKYASEKGIRVINCPTYNSAAVAEHAVALMFAAARRIPQAYQHVRQSGWDSQTFVGTELSGKSLGLVGYGRIGKHIEKLARGLGMQASYVNSKSEAQEIDDLIQRSDIVCLCAALTDSTRGMIDERRLRLMKEGSMLVNVSRGAVMDQQALEGLLAEGWPVRVALDVFESEPLTGTPSESIVKLLGYPNVIGTPHIGYNTKEASARLGEELLANVEGCLNGSPMNLVS